MSQRGHYIVCLLVLLSICAGARAQQASVGLFSSPKGYGANAQFPSSLRKDAFHDLTLYADTYGIFMGKCFVPGMHFNYSFDTVFHRFAWRDMECRMYTGPGISLGWVREFEKGLFDPDTRYFMSPGGLAALNAAFGLQFQCHERVRLDLRWEAQVGIFYRDDYSAHATSLSLFKKGIYQLFYPELIIQILL